MSKHTPGTWFTSRPTTFGTVYVEARIDGGMIQEIAAVGPTAEHEQQEANANLIKAAPDLLDALKALADAVDSCVDLTPETLLKARVAIAKATGEKA